MPKFGMSKHDQSSFNESETVNFLSSVLESKHTIKTFFSANDRTPNHDGFFELVDEESTPKKQFIVQIKKTENLKPNIQGKNKGKYVYNLKTNFLCYVKEKVTESPAIYFVVDITAKKIFWLYLSDELLMSLNFEGHEYISVAFGNENILKDINEFAIRLHQIADKRNYLFLQKTSEEIIELQDALDYINHLFDYDFVNIKASMFPNLWRFGIKSSQNSDISLESNGNIFTPDTSSLLSLYPQIKGVNDTGIHEFTFNDTNIFNQIYIGKKISPMQYAQESVHKAIKFFFENGIPVKYLPDIVLKEKVWKFVDKTNILFGVNNIDSISTEDLERRLQFILKYIGKIITSNELTNSELQMRHSIFTRLNSSANILDISSFVSCGCLDSFKIFFSKEKDNPFPIHKIVLNVLNRDSLELINIIGELKNRSIHTVNAVWEYDWYMLRQMGKSQFLPKVNDITSKWLDNLPVIYNETYSNLIETSKYKYNNKIIYKNYIFKTEFPINHFFTLFHKYPNNPFEVYNDESIGFEFTDEAQKNGISNIKSGSTLDDFIDNKLLYFESLNCLIYKGICEKLGFKPESLKIGSGNLTRGLSIF